MQNNRYSNMKSLINLDSKKIAIISSFSVIYGISRIIPSFPVVGVPGASFSLGDVLIPIYGIFLGPTLGFASIMLGTFLGFVFGKPPIFLGWDFLPAASATLFVGLMMRNKRMISAVLFLIALTIFLLLPYTEILISLNEQVQIPFNWMHIIALLLIISPIGKSAIRSISDNTSSFIVGFFIIAITSTLFQHIIGGIMFQTTLGIYLGAIEADAFPRIWQVIFYVYPIERIAIAILATIVGVPVIKSLKRSGLAQRF